MVPGKQGWALGKIFVSKRSLGFEFWRGGGEEVRGERRGGEEVRGERRGGEEVRGERRGGEEGRKKKGGGSCENLVDERKLFVLLVGTSSGSFGTTRFCDTECSVERRKKKIINFKEK